MITWLCALIRWIRRPAAPDDEQIEQVLTRVLVVGVLSAFGAGAMWSLADSSAKRYDAQIAIEPAYLPTVMDRDRVAEAHAERAEARADRIHWFVVFCVVLVVWEFVSVLPFAVMLGPPSWFEALRQRYKRRRARLAIAKQARRRSRRLREKLAEREQIGGAADGAHDSDSAG